LMLSWLFKKTITLRFPWSVWLRSGAMARKRHF
jgi:hypothetical protein